MCGAILCGRVWLWGLRNDHEISDDLSCLNWLVLDIESSDHSLISRRLHHLFSLHHLLGIDWRLDGGFNLGPNEWRGLNI